MLTVFPDLESFRCGLVPGRGAHQLCDFGKSLYLSEPPSYQQNKDVKP